MSLVDSILNIFLGDKGKKDIKEVSPIVDLILKCEDEIKDISNDDLRSITASFKSEIKELKKPFSLRLTTLKILLRTLTTLKKMRTITKKLKNGNKLI
tara:strand:+ start:1041 stop:1334 length:294 start_codon:yes stop_codon:yes gene_type:complete